MIVVKLLQNPPPPNSIHNTKILKYLARKVYDAIEAEK